MLIRFVVQNYLSFHDEVEFNMLTSDSEQHLDHVHSLDDQIKLLPIAAIYGANASGKTNLLKAIKYARALIVEGSNEKGSSLHRSPFKLNTQAAAEPSRFEFEFFSKDCAYSYGLEINDAVILEEWLYQVHDDECLFHRKGKSFEFGSTYSREDISWLENEGRGTPANQTFLRECNRRDVPFFNAAYEWLQHLVVISPESRPISLESEWERDDVLRDFMTRSLTLADLGIEGMELQHQPVSNEMLNMLQGTFEKQTPPNSVILGINGVRHYVTKSGDGSLNASKLVTRRKGMDDTVLFNLDEESDGTQRLIELTPAFRAAITLGRVCLIDELERSLHPQLCQRLIDLFLASRGPESQGQIIFTTHNTELLDNTRLRPDEIWFVDKNCGGQSKLYPLSDFKNFPPDIRTGYLSGRFGATPLLNPNISFAGGVADGTAKQGL